MPDALPICAFILAVSLAALASAGDAWPVANPISPDEEAAFGQRAEFYIHQTAARDTDAMIEWFDGVDYFKGQGGDRHKYILAPIIAKLSLDPDDEAALRAYRMLMAVDVQKGDRGLYHFAAFQRARLYFQLRDKLPDDVIASTNYDVRNFFDVLRRGGTENHQFMQRASGLVFAEHVEGPYRNTGKSREQHRAELRDWLIEQTRLAYTVGLGEYDSSTYLGFTAASIANVYDFSDDPATRLWAKAMLDWIAVAMARKYYHGVSLGPEARGFADETVGNARDVAPTDAGTDALKHRQTGAHSDWVAWLWFGDAHPGPILAPASEVNRFPALNLALSGYRPDPIVRTLALKQNRSDYEARGSHPAYDRSRANKDQETLFFADHFAMGTLYSPDPGVRTSGTILPQTTMFKLLLNGKDTVHAIGMSNGYHRHFPLEGRTPFDQYAQHRNVAINICYVADHDGLTESQVRPRSILGVPRAVNHFRDGEWYVFSVERAFVAARPLNGHAEWLDQLDTHKPDERYRWLVSPGTLTGWVVVAGRQSGTTPFESFPGVSYGGGDDFAGDIRRQTRLDLSGFDEARRTVRFTTDRGDVLVMRHTGGPGGRPEFSVNGKPIDYEHGFPVFDSPFVQQQTGSGKLRVTDGKTEVIIDVNGELPTWTRRPVE